MTDFITTWAWIILVPVSSGLIVWALGVALGYRARLRITKAREQLESLSGGGTDGQKMDVEGSKGKDLRA
ncbi:MAG: hypothetical protein J6J16_09720 [Lachnospiraceae bacterium]|nr:hypothetical protein [Lachnospiraceae bacterium]